MGNLTLQPPSRLLWIGRLFILLGLVDRLFKQIGDNWIPQCWGNKAYFDKLRNYVKIMLPKTQPVR